MKKGLFLHAIIVGLVVLSGCSTFANGETPPATLTLAPNVSRTPRFTATPIPTPHAAADHDVHALGDDHPADAFRYAAASPTPPILGSVNSLQSINMRSVPASAFSAISALRPATRVQILGRNNDGTWLNIRLDDGSEGWVSADLIRLQPTPTPFPSLTPSPNLTSVAEGTTLPTALFGGGTITPTPPRSISGGATPTPVLENANPATVAGCSCPISKPSTRQRPRWRAAG